MIYRDWRVFQIRFSLIQYLKRGESLFLNILPLLTSSLMLALSRRKNMVMYTSHFFLIKLRIKQSKNFAIIKNIPIFAVPIETQTVW